MLISIDRLDVNQVLDLSTLLSVRSFAMSSSMIAISVSTRRSFSCRISSYCLLVRTDIGLYLEFTIRRHRGSFGAIGVVMASVFFLSRELYPFWPTYPKIVPPRTPRTVGLSPEFREKLSILEVRGTLRIIVPARAAERPPAIELQYTLVLGVISFLIRVSRRAHRMPVRDDQPSSALSHQEFTY